MSEAPEFLAGLDEPRADLSRLDIGAISREGNTSGKEQDSCRKIGSLVIRRDNMPLYSTWIVEGHLAYWKSWGALKAEDIPPYDAESFDLLNATTAPMLHTIANHSQLEQLPPLKDLASITAGRDPRVGWYLVVGNINPVIKMLVSIAVQIGHVRLRFFPTFDEALDFICGQDATLSPIFVSEAELIERIRERHAAVSAEPTPF